MNLTYTRPGELRKPDVEVLPDGRIRVTRYIAAGHGDRDLSEVTEAVGSTDSGLSTALLVKKGMARVEGKDAIVKTYEVRNASTETRIGNDDIQFGENGLKTIVADFVQMSSGTYVPGVVGTSVSSLDATCVLRSEVVEDDGTSRLIRRTYINKGLLSITDETRNNGALFIKTLVYLNDVPSPNPPTGYVLISQRTENPLGLETTTLTFAKGEGQVSQDDDTKNNGALLLRTIRYISAPGTLGIAGTNPIATPSGYVLITQNYQESEGHRIWNASYAKGVGEISRDIDYSQTSDQGVTGITRTSIRYLVAPSGAVQPSVLAGSVKIGESITESDGHRVWTTVWAKGTGFVVNASEYRNNQKLLITRQTYIGSSGPSTPSPVIGGVVVQISYSYREESGYRVWDLVWAEGIGEISRSIDYSQSSDQGVTGITRTTIRYLVAPSAAIQPATLSGSVLIQQSVSDEEGYRVWTTTWAKGTGTISSTTNINNQGKLNIYRISSLGTAPTAPTATISGTVTLIDFSTRQADGHTIHDYTWAEGKGVVSTREQQRPGGLRLVTWVSLGQSYDSGYMTPAGVLMAKDSDERDGHTVWTVTTMQLANGGADPTSGTAHSYITKHPFRYPGRAKAITTTFVIGGYSTKYCHDVYKSPPADVQVDATVTITYQLSSNINSVALSYALWNPDSWATIIAKYWGWNAYPKAVVETLLGYRSVSETPITFSGGGTGAEQTCLGDRVFGIGSGSPYSIAVYGGPVAPDNNTYTLAVELDQEPAFVAYDGTKYYRKTVVHATIPTQTALPSL